MRGGRGLHVANSHVRSFSSNQERQHHERVGLEPGALADLLGLRQVDSRPGAWSPSIEIERGEAIVAGKEELRLVRPPRRGASASSVVRERHAMDHRGTGRSGPSTISGTARWSSSPSRRSRSMAAWAASMPCVLAPVGKRAVGHREIGIEPGLEPEIADLLGHLQARRGRSRCCGAGRASYRARQGSRSRGRRPAADRASRRAPTLRSICSTASSSRPSARQRDAERVVGLGARRPPPPRALRVGPSSSASRSASASACSAHSIAAALSPLRKASRPISWKRCARSIGLAVDPEQARAQPRSTARGALAVASVPVQARRSCEQARRAPARSRPPRATLPRRPRSAPSAFGSMAGERRASRPASRARHEPLRVDRRRSPQACPARAGSGESHPRSHRAPRAQSPAAMR